MQRSTRSVLHTTQNPVIGNSCLCMFIPVATASWRRTFEGKKIPTSIRFGREFPYRTCLHQCCHSPPPPPTTTTHTPTAPTSKTPPPPPPPPPRPQPQQQQQQHAEQPWPAISKTHFGTSKSHEIRSFQDKWHSNVTKYSYLQLPHKKDDCNVFFFSVLLLIFTYLSDLSFSLL